MGEIAAAMAESKLEKKQLMRMMAVSESELMRMMGDVKAKEETHGVNKLIVKRMMDLEEKETGGDDFLFWMEETAIKSTKRIDALNAELCDFYGQCSKFAVDRYLFKSIPVSKADKKALFALGVFSKEFLVLQHEYAKSVAELCIKKMRLGALVDKCDKRRTLMMEILTARYACKDFADLTSAFKKALLDIRAQLQQDPHASIQVSRELIDKHMEPRSSYVKLRSDYEYKADAFARESFRVLVEMMRGVKVGGLQPPVKGLDDAMELGKRWTEAVLGMCVMKVMFGTVVKGRSIFEVLKSEIAENWKMEKEVKDKILAYQKEHARPAQGFPTGIVEEEMNVGADTVVKGDETIKEKNSGLGTVEVTVAEGDETINKDKKRFATMSGDEEVTKQDSKAKTKPRMSRLVNIRLISMFFLVAALLFAWFQGQEKGKDDFVLFKFD